MQANRAALATRGVAFLDSPGERGHRLLAACCMRDNRADDFLIDHRLTSPERRTAFFGNFRKRFAAKIAALPETTRAVLVSSERFHSRLVHTDEIAALRSLFTPFCSRVSIIVYLREQLDMALDSYAAALQNGGCEDLPRFLLRRCRPGNPFYNHYETLRKWTEVFGRENVRARLFQPRRADGDLPRDFLDQVDPSLAPCLTVRVPPQNPPPDAFGQCLLRALNRHLPQRRDDGGRDALNLAITRLVARRTANAGPWDATVDPELAAAIRDRFLATNELVRRDYFPQLPLLFPPGEDGCGAGEPRLTRDREELLGEVLGCFAEGLRSQARQLRTRRAARSTRPAPVAQAGPAGPSGPEDPAGVRGTPDRADSPGDSFVAGQTAGPGIQPPRLELANRASRAGHRANDAGEAIDERSATPAAIPRSAPLTAPRH